MITKVGTITEGINLLMNFEATVTWSDNRHEPNRNF